MTRDGIGFDGMIAVVTGAAGGIGRACAGMLASRGAHVVAVDIDPRVHEAQETPPERWRPVLGDLTREMTLDAVRQAAAQLHGRVAVLVNSAFAEERGSLAASTDQGWLHTFEVSTLAAVRMSRWFVDAATAPAAIVNVASIHAFAARQEFAAYSAAKAALVAFTRSSAVEWGPLGVRVNAVAPGFVAVERNAHLWGDPPTRVKLASSNPLGRIGEPDDVAKVVAFLASAESSFVTGTVVPVDGGLLARLPEEII